MSTQTSKTSHRPWWLNAYRATTVVLLSALVVLGVITVVKLNDLHNRSFVSSNTAQTNKVEKASAFLQVIGFDDPRYLGITPGSEGEYPTYEATGPNNQSVKLWIRTGPDGSWEVQHASTFQTVKSSDDLARLAVEAVWKWENKPSSLKPRTDGASGEYEALKYDFAQLSRFKPSGDYWKQPRSEVEGWPRK